MPHTRQVRNCAEFAGHDFIRAAQKFDFISPVTRKWSITADEKAQTDRLDRCEIARAGPFTRVSDEQIEGTITCNYVGGERKERIGRARMQTDRCVLQRFNVNSAIVILRIARAIASILTT